MTIIPCPHCGHENPEGQVLCVKCSLPLNLSALGEDETHHLEDAMRDRRIPGPMPIGTARMGAEQLLLLHVRGHDEPLKVTLTNTVVFGRRNADTGELPDIGLDEFDAREHGISRRHTKLSYDAGIIQVMDLGSRNGTFLNGQKLIAHQNRILRDGDELRLGTLVIRVIFVK